MEPSRTLAALIAAEELQKVRARLAEEAGQRQRAAEIASLQVVDLDGQNNPECQVAVQGPR